MGTEKRGARRAGASGAGPEQHGRDQPQRLTCSWEAHRPRWPGTRRRATASRAGHAFVANYDDATVSVLDTHSGALLRTVALGQRPTALSVDEAAGRVFTLNSARIDSAVPYAASAPRA